MDELRRVKSLVPRDRLIHWITEREMVRQHKEKGDPKPWTADPILQSYRFCNVRRMDDKVSQWLLRNWYEPHKNHANMLAAVAIARFINKPESLETLGRWLFRNGPPRWDMIKADLHDRKNYGPVFNGAYMVRGNSPNTKDKVVIVVDEYVKPMFETVQWYNADSMKATHSLLCLQYGFGSFMAGQIVADLRWAVDGGWKDRNTWAPMGPGSARGLARLFGGEWKTLNGHYLNRPDEWQTDFRREVLGKVKEQLPPEVSSRLEAMDYQNICCEWDKHERALWGEGKPKQRYPGTG